MFIKCNYIQSKGNSIEEQLDYLFNSGFETGTIIRLVFFGNPTDNEEYKKHLTLIARFVERKFEEKAPVFSYVAQPPLEQDTLILEVFEAEWEAGTEVHYKKQNDLPYIILQNGKSKKLFVGGVLADSLKNSIRTQSDQVFSKLKDIFICENMPVSSIVRQWNYIEQITKIEGTHQHYQDFNDARTHFYTSAIWNNGFPAATGIGTSFGGIMIDLEAFCFTTPENRIIPLDNSLQVPAFGYSEKVLIGEEDKELKQKTTPKFERAKLVLENGSGLIYVSGTAAIRGENSLADVGIEEQTRITLENVEHLISGQTLSESKSGLKGYGRICSLRVYLKGCKYLEAARNVVKVKYAKVPVCYVLADVCRDELLVEIEGIALIENKINLK